MQTAKPNKVRLKMPVKPTAPTMRAGLLVLAGTDCDNCSPGMITSHCDSLVGKLLVTMLSTGITMPMAKVPYCEPLPSDAIITISGE